LISKIESILDKLKKSDTAGAHLSVARSEQRRRPCRPRSDCGRHYFATPMASPPPPLRLQLAPPPSVALRGYKGRTPDSSFPLFTSMPRSSLLLPGLPLSTSPVPALSAHFLTQPGGPRALVQCRAAPRPSRLSPRPPVLPSTTGSCLLGQPPP
jgi:hypothetical protein